jgi:hypothetical protein
MKCSAMMNVSKYAIWIGLLTIAAGLLYDVMFAGIPYQDPPDDLLAEYYRHQRISGWIINVGVLVGAVGVLGGIIIRVRRGLMKS